MFDENILNTCVERLRKLPPIKSLKIKKPPAREKTNIDRLLTIVTEGGDLQFAVEVTGVVKRPLPHHFAHTKEKLDINFLLMSEYINPSIAEDLKQNGLYYIDCQGNAYIEIKKYIYVDIQGISKQYSPEKISTTLFQPTGLQLLFILLAYPEKLNAPLRELQKLSSISYGQTQAGMKELKEKYVVKDQIGLLTFRDANSMFQKWLTHYSDRLRPKLILDSFRIAPSMEREATQRLDDLLSDEEDSYAISGSFGADKLIPFYRGTTTEIFIRPDLLYNVKNSLKLMPAKETNLTLFNLFSPWIIYREKLRPPVAHPLLIYAELLNQGNSRAKETAKMIYDTFLRILFNGAG